MSRLPGSDVERRPVSARERLIFSAIDLMRRRGVAGTGVADILEHGGVSRRMIYLNFADGKAGLMAEATRVAGDFIDAQIESFVQRGTPREALAAFISEWKRVVSSSDFTAGCPIAAAASSRSSTPEVASLAGEAFQRWQTTMSGSLVQHGLDEATARTLANTVLAAVEGAVTMCVAQESVTALDDIESQLALLIDHHVDAAGH